MNLTTKQLILRDFRSDDWHAVLEYQSDPLYLRYNPWTTREPEDVRRFVNMFIQQQSAQPRIKFQLAVVLKITGQLIGNCGIRKRAPDAHEGDIGYEIDPRYWGNGYATEAARAIMQFGFDELKLHRISAWCVAENGGSARVLRKLGMQQEGHLRENEYFKDRYWDSLIFAILDREWAAQQPHTH